MTKNRGLLHVTLSWRSIALPVASTSESVFSAPITEMPSGKLTTPIGRVRCGYPAIAARYPAPTQAGHTSPLIRSIGGANGPEGLKSTSTLALLSSWSIPFCPLAALIASTASLCGAEPALGCFRADKAALGQTAQARSRLWSKLKSISAFLMSRQVLHLV